MSAAHQGFGSLRHLTGRFFESLRPGGPQPDEDAWATSQLLPGEGALWGRMSGPDRRHAVGVARDAITDLASDGDPAVPRAVVAAALLHDVGKVESGLGTWARALVTVVAMLAGRSRVAGWSPPPGVDGEDTAGAALRPGGRQPGRPRTMRAAAGRYVTHDRAGAALLRRAGSDPLTVAWAAEHHLPETSWTVEARIATALKAADGD